MKQRNSGILPFYPKGDGGHSNRYAGVSAVVLATVLFAVFSVQLWGCWRCKLGGLGSVMLLVCLHRTNQFCGVKRALILPAKPLSLVF